MDVKNESNATMFENMFSNRFGYLLAAAATLVLLMSVVAFEGDSVPVRLVMAMGALGQVWIAAMVWQLSKQQFDFVRQASEQNFKASVFDPRRNLMEKWKSHCRQIGVTQLNAANVEVLASLVTDIKFLFGPSAHIKARKAIAAARLAKKLAEKSGDASKLRSNADYRLAIQGFDQAKDRLWQEMDSKLKLEN